MRPFLITLLLDMYVLMKLQTPWCGVMHGACISLFLKKQSQALRETGMCAMCCAPEHIMFSCY